MFEFKIEKIPCTFGEYRFLITKDSIECFQFEYDTVRHMIGLGIDPVEELTTMIVYELKDDTVREEILELLKNNITIG